MDIETITKLLDAGYTKADIDAMERPSEENKATGENVETPKENESHASAENESAITPDLAKMVESLTASVRGLENTVKSIQESNAGKAATETPKKDTIGDVMQSFIDTL